MYKITENDWKHLHSLQLALIDRYCGQTLAHVRKIVGSTKFGEHLKQCQKLYPYLDKREKILVAALNDFRRSNAMFKIEEIRRLGLFTQEEFDGFSDELRSQFYDDRQT